MLLFVITLIGALVLGCRLYFIQIVHGSEYVARAERQYSRPNDRLFDRGKIYFEDKNGLRLAAATLLSGYILSIDPALIEDAEGTYAALAEVITLDQKSFLTKAAKKDDPYEEVARQLTEGDMHAIDALDLPGVSLYRERWRYYPAERTASRTIGFVGWDEAGTGKTGLYGLERYYDDVLTRTTAVDVNFFADLFASVGTVLAGSHQGAGDVVTSIEPKAQFTLEQELQKVHNEWDSRQTGGIIMDPVTGEIVAMAVMPDFDLNTYEVENDPAVYANPLVSSVYEMGSIIKPLTVSAGLDAKAITAETTYVDHGYVEVDDYTIRNFDGLGRGRVPMQEILSQSLNTGVAFIVNQMGTGVFADYFRAFGLGEETGIDLPGEAHGLIHNLDSPRDVEYATASFGQGIATTPIATVRALSALAADGVLPTPHIGKSIVYQDGYTKEVSFPKGTQVISKETSDEITRMLIEVVDTALAHGDVKLPHYSVAAKTGTAQIAKKDGRGYYDDRYLHSFFGYFPAYEPRFIVFLYTLEPQGVRYASQTLTMPFHELTKFLISYYEIPPDR